MPLTSPAQADGARDTSALRLSRKRVHAVRWILPAHIAVLGLAAVVYVFNLSVSGYANSYYSMAAQAASLDWGAWFWGALDPSNFITIDKPPLATMLMGLSVRLFGLSSWSILLPEAVCGVATIAVLYAIVRRTSGPVAATLAAVVATLTPAAVLIFRFNNPDALLTLLLVLAASAFVRSLGDARLRWVVLAAVFVGLAFNTKFLQAYLVLPAFAVTYIVAAPGRVRQRFVGLIVAGATVIVSSGWWVLAVQLVPASMRPYVGGSTDGTALQLLFGYDGLGRILGFGSAPSVGIAAGVGAGQGGLGGGAGANFSGIPGLLRMFNSQLGGQVAWLLPFASFAGVASIVLRIRQARTDLARAAALMWTLWLVVHVLVFSLMSGIIHSYYTVVLAPAIGALVGMGSVEFWRARAEHRVLAALALAGALGGSAVLAWQLLLRTPDFVPGLAWLVLAFGSVSAFVIALGAVLPAGSWGRGRLVRRATTGAATLGLVMLLAGPAAYAADTVVTAYSGGDPAAGPSILSDGGSGFAGFPGRQFAGLPEGSLPGGFNWGGDGRPGDGDGGGGPGAAIPGRGSLNGAAVIGREALEYLVANRASAKWIVAANSADEAAPIQLATGQPVMTMGGFNGQDPAPTLEQLKQYIASGDLRFVLANTIGGFGGPSLGRDSGIATWVETNCSLVNISVSAAVRLYDCAGAS